MPGAGRFFRFDWHCALTVFVSACLLFLVQPLLSKYILPWFGGSPAVWTACMLFFQVVLCAGYAYAHWLEHFVPPKWQKIGHVTLLLAALATLPITPSDDWKPGGVQSATAQPATGQPTGQILMLLAVCVGLPYFALSSTGPLVQAWFGRAYPDRSPYRLYALSNAGSLLALLSYPFLIEAALPVNMQAWYWSLAFAAYCALYAWATLRVAARLSPVESPEVAAIQNSTEQMAPRWRDRARWIALPAFASMMLLATTNHVCQDVASIPFLWVVPLSLYLITFIITFDHSRWYRRLPLAAITLFAVYIAVGSGNPKAWSALQAIYEVVLWAMGGQVKQWNASLGYREQLVVYFSTLFLICMLCHGELYRLRPNPRYLTSFYLLISVGGALGGLFVSLVAPQIFATYLEWNIGLIGGFLLAGLIVVSEFWRWRPQCRNKQRLKLAICATGLCLAGWALTDAVQLLDYRTSPKKVVLEQTRNFYGTVQVARHDTGDPATNRMSLVNGRIIHGVQLTDGDRRGWPTTYYAEASGVGEAFGFYQEKKQPLRVGAIGLGVGTLAAYARQGDTLRFYEINPTVIRMAETYFTFLGDARQRGASVELVPGDARLSLEWELARQPNQFDLLVLDAFSGDAIPNHLLTREMFETYLAHLAEDGTIAVHISNQYVDLTTVVLGLARHFHLQGVRIWSPDDDQRAQSGADWIILSRDRALLQKLHNLETAQHDTLPAELPLWTDQSNDLLEILK